MAPLRYSVIGISAGLLLLAAGGTAAAITPQELSAAKSVAAAAEKSDLADYFARLDRQRGMAVEGPAEAPKLVGEPHEVMTLNPQFVAGVPGAAPAVFAHLSIQADSANGQHASVWLGRAGDGWTVQHITGDLTDLTVTAAGGAVFDEPQIGAWYRLSGNRVLPLNDAARIVAGPYFTVQAYQERVHRLYADGAQGGSDAGVRAQEDESDSRMALLIALPAIVGGFVAYRFRRRIW
ncbi:hypothetical protein D5S17_13510 [Pseudonocardiaceae bacterium YIM PH 21723]|nr:hypothetical protein D5S17_13510 [Pseudonocardiaceae bacterium YIM PH 21723]